MIVPGGAAFLLFVAGPAWAAPTDGSSATPSTAVQPVIDMDGAIIQILGYLVALGLLAWLAARMGKWLQPRMGTGPLQVLGGRALAPGVGVRLVRVGKRVWMLGVSKESVSVLAELSPEELESGGDVKS